MDDASSSARIRMSPNNLAVVVVVALLQSFLTVALFAQDSPIAKPKPKPKVTSPAPKASSPKPTLGGSVEYVRAELISRSPSDGADDNVEVGYDATEKVLTVTDPNGRCDNSLSVIDPKSAVWDQLKNGRGTSVLRLTMASMIGKTARICYDKSGHVDASYSGSRFRFVFLLPTTNEVPEFEEKMTKAFKDDYRAERGCLRMTSSSAPKEY